MTPTDARARPRRDPLRPDALGERLAAHRKARRRVVRLAVILASLALATSAAAAGVAILGSPAPPAVKRDLLDVDRGMPRDLRLNPDVAHARAVAASNGSVVYFAALKGGGYCAELVTRAAGPRGAVCSTAQQAQRTPISVTVPFSDPVRPDSPVTVSGRVASPSARTVELVYPDGASDSVGLGERGFYAAEVPPAHLAAVHQHGLLLVARDGDGKPLAQAVIPTDAITPPSEAERPDPIQIDTVSTERDFTRVLRVRGELHLAGVDHLTLRYPDGTTVRVPLRGRRFDYAIPTVRQHDLMTPGTVTAWRADGRALAHRPVAAVAYWRAREGGRG
ncbi:MAG TPA: hypothetical protein VGQ92_07870 [Actinoplanes sp.]|nr:hypothetical protein [Actinoplanes sp.]